MTDEVVSMSRLRRLGVQRKPEPPVPGEPAGLLLAPVVGIESVRTVDAILTLQRSGMSLIDAKSAIEAMVITGQASVFVPRVSDTLMSRLATAGVMTKRVIVK